LRFLQLKNINFGYVYDMAKLFATGLVMHSLLHWLQMSVSSATMFKMKSNSVDMILRIIQRYRCTKLIWYLRTILQEDIITSYNLYF